MTLAVSIPAAGVELADLPDHLRDATEWGYTAAWAGEAAGPDFASVLGGIALAGPPLDLGVAVAPVQTRAPWLLAATASTLSQLSRGRFSLGVGPSSELIVERWSGVPFDRPLQRTRETVEVLRRWLDGEKVEHDGDFFSTRSYRLFAPPPAPVPIIVGALNPRSLRQAGEIGDGVALNQLGPHNVADVLAEVRTGAERAGKRLEDLEVVARLFCLVTDDVPAAREIVRHTFTPYAATTGYNRFFAYLGFEEEMKTLWEAFARRDREAATTAFTDELVDTIAILGDEDDVAAGVRAHLDAGVTTAAIAAVTADRSTADRTLRAAARAETE
jgi:probable F420-dependent oxidoreductase